MKLQEILKDTNYKLTQFKTEDIKELEDSIFIKELKNGKFPYILCKVRKKEIKLTPEEIVRQLFLIKLNKEYGYDYDRMQVEFIVHFGREKKREEQI